jgi:hypothetical protein
MRDEHADACACPSCAWPEPEAEFGPVRLVWINQGRAAPEPIAHAIDAQLPAILARDLRSVYQPQADLPADILDASRRADERLKAFR